MTTLTLLSTVVSESFFVLVSRLMTSPLLSRELSLALSEGDISNMSSMESKSGMVVADKWGWGETVRLGWGEELAGLGSVLVGCGEVLGGVLVGCGEVLGGVLVGCGEVLGGVLVGCGEVLGGVLVGCGEVLGGVLVGCGEVLGGVLVGCGVVLIGWGEGEAVLDWVVLITGSRVSVLDGWGEEVGGRGEAVKAGDVSIGF